MQYVSPEYKESMKQPLRNRGYMRVVFGLGNNIATQAHISGNQVSYSNPSRVFNNGIDDFVYATLEENFTKLDGSMYFYGSGNRETAYISANLVSEENAEVTFSFDSAVSFDKLIFNFGDNYPTHFTIDNQEYENTSGRICEISVSFENITEFTMIVTEMVNQESRFRLYSVRFSQSIEYRNDMILDSNLNSSFSPIGEELPQMDFSVKLINENHYFDTDNEKSILNLFDTSTEVSVYYGYQLADHVEWLQAAKLYVSDWSSERESAMINAVDILQVNDVKYTQVLSGTVSLYALAENIFAQMGISDYEIDSDLQSVTTNNALSDVSCKEALQIVANAGCKKLFIMRNGCVKIGEELETTYNFSSNGKMNYSQIANILNDGIKYDYVTLEWNFTKLDGSMYFYGTPYKTTGYISSQISDNHGLFIRSGDVNLSERVLSGNIINLPYDLGESVSSDGMPVLSINFTTPTEISGFNLTFGTTYCTKFRVKGYLNQEILTAVNVVNNSKIISVGLPEISLDKLDIEFIETAQPYNRVRVNYIEIIQSVYHFDEIDMMSYPNFRKFEKLKSITVPYFSGGNGVNVTEDLNEKGVVIEWVNPLVNTQARAETLIGWLKTYYLCDGEYSYQTRGNPEIDVNDEATQMKYNGKKINVLITETSLEFDGAFSGAVKVLKKRGGE